MTHARITEAETCQGPEADCRPGGRAALPMRYRRSACAADRLSVWTEQPLLPRLRVGIKRRHDRCELAFRKAISGIIDANTEAGLQRFIQRRNIR